MTPRPHARARAPRPSAGGGCLIAALLSAALLAGGCGLDDVEAHRKNIHEIQTLRDKNRSLAQENEGLQKRLAEADKQIATLQALGPKRLDKVYHVQKIELGRYSGGIDLNGKPGHDAVKVILLPVDQEGDTIKASGSALVQLYDLAAPPDQNLLGEYRWSPEQIAKHWYSGFLTYYYGLECPLKSPPKHDEITVRAEFTDYLTGRKFTAQAVVKIDLPPAARPSPPTTGPATAPATAPAAAPATAPGHPATRPAPATAPGRVGPKGRRELSRG